MKNLLQIKNNQVTVSTLTIAEQTEKTHKVIINLIKTNIEDFEEFGRVTFEKAPFETNGGNQNVTYTNLNEQQYSLLMTYLRNNPKVKEFKKNMIKAFFAMRDIFNKKESQSISGRVAGLTSGNIRLRKKIKELENKLSNQKLLPPGKTLDEKASELERQIDQVLKENPDNWGFFQERANYLSRYFKVLKGTEQNNRSS